MRLFSRKKDDSDAIKETLADYQHGISNVPEQHLKNLVEDYGLKTKGNTRQSYIDALTEDLRKDLKRGK